MSTTYDRVDEWADACDIDLFHEWSDHSPADLFQRDKRIVDEDAAYQPVPCPWRRRVCIVDLRDDFQAVHCTWGRCLAVWCSARLLINQRDPDLVFSSGLLHLVAVPLEHVVDGLLDCGIFPWTVHGCECESVSQWRDDFYSSGLTLLLWSLWSLWSLWCLSRLGDREERRCLGDLISLFFVFQTFWLIRVV